MAWPPSRTPPIPASCASSATTRTDRAQPTLGSVLGPAGTRYDTNGRGGTTTLDFNEATRTLVRDFISLNGTIVNCAGGISVGQRAWVTCEETTANQGTGSAPGWAQNHGYAFEVPLDLAPNTTAPAVPIPAMGRFAHEALCVDQRTGIVYQTEDAGSGVGSGFYRYIPNDPENLLAGGTLQMLAIRNKPQYDTREGQKRGRWLPCVWVDISNPDPANAGNSSPDRVFTQGWNSAEPSSTASRAAGGTSPTSSSWLRAAATPRTAT